MIEDAFRDRRGGLHRRIILLFVALCLLLPSLTILPVALLLISRPLRLFADLRQLHPHVLKTVHRPGGDQPSDETRRESLPYVNFTVTVCSSFVSHNPI